MRSVAAIGLLATAPLPAAAQSANPCAPAARGRANNPCAPRAGNPCAPNPCAAKPANPCAPNPCAAKGNPCAAAAKVDPKLVTRPKGTKLLEGSRATLVRDGERLFKSEKLSTNGMACSSCHGGGEGFQASFAKPYPHEVAMAFERGGMKSIQLDEMIQFCMIVPMEAKPLPWQGRDLAALTAYNEELQKAFQAKAKPGANPCAPRSANPCAPKAQNPCAPKNPCAPRR
jgi:cytochrome c